ncbi:hypothetical protein RUM43_009967 [Polyplax serrata]|uniref:Uncharacterized protein n=1 Tax=Polyplax serrata TaxID=468196 RepID=A0AAN8P3I3_POLSC
MVEEQNKRFEKCAFVQERERETERERKEEDRKLKSNRMRIHLRPETKWNVGMSGTLTTGSRRKDEYLEKHREGDFQALAERRRKRRQK